MTTTPDTQLEWQRWPLREDGRVGWFRAGGVIFLLLLIEAILLLSLPTMTAIVLGIPLALALLPYFLPRRYQLSDKGLVILRGFWNDHREWHEFRTYQPVTDGYWLLPDPTQPAKLRGILSNRAFYLSRPLDPQLAQTLEHELAARLKPHSPPS
jgi:hypothetical protein